MKISEMPAEKAFEAMGRMIPHVSAILEDSAVAGCKAMIGSKNASGAQLLGSVMPLMLTKHSDHLFAIVAAATGMAEDEVKTMPLSELRTAFEDAWKDVLDFFPFCLRLVANA